MNRLKLCNQIVEITKNSPEIGVFCSGGFDSTLLLYSVCKTFSHQNIDKIVNIFTVARYDDSVTHVKRVVKWILNQYPKLKIEIHYPGNPNLHHSEQVLSGIKEILHSNSAITMLLGDTNIPAELKNNNAPTRIKSSHSRIIQPFIDYDKRITLQIAQEFGILNDLAQITHTCTESKTIRCRNCWQCAERAWAFTNLNLNDIGIM